MARLFIYLGWPTAYNTTHPNASLTYFTNHETETPIQMRCNTQLGYFEAKRPCSTIVHGLYTTNSLNFRVNLDKERRVVVPLSKDDMFFPLGRLAAPSSLCKRIFLLLVEGLEDSRMGLYVQERRSVMGCRCLQNGTRLNSQS